MGAGETAVSGTGKNLGKKDISTVAKGTPGFTDEISTTQAKREANAEGQLLPYQENKPVDTTQPSPQTATIQPPNQSPMVPYEQAQQNLAKGGLTGTALGSAQQSLAGAYGKSKYEIAHEALKGTQAPASPGLARSAVMGAVPKEPDQTAVDQVFSEDPVINNLMGQAYELLSPENTKGSLMQDYKKLYKESGLKDINEELIDAETIIDGTEDDIRNEIQTAGGFATDSQVQAMTLARNKGLLKRYNQLFAMKQSAEQQLQTMLNITQQDRQMAQQRVTNQINTLFQFANFRQQAQNAYRETAKFALQTLGADGLYNSMKGDSKQIAAYEKIFGLPSGGLATAASQAAKTRADEEYMKSLQRQKLEKDLAPATEEPFTPYQQERDVRIVDTASDLFRRAGADTVGLGAVKKWLPASKARDFATDLAKLKGNVFASELQAMRADSKTGGAIGNASDKEGEKLENAIAGLDQFQSEASFKKNMVQAIEAVVRYHQAKGDPQYAGVFVDRDPGSATYGQLIQIID